MAEEGPIAQISVAGNDSALKEGWCVCYKSMKRKNKGKKHKDRGSWTIKHADALKHSC